MEQCQTVADATGRANLQNLFGWQDQQQKNDAEASAQAGTGDTSSDHGPVAANPGSGTPGQGSGSGQGGTQDPKKTQPTNGLDKLKPLMEVQENTEAWLTKHVLIPAAMVTTGAIVADGGVVATIAVCSTGAGCFLSPITAGVMLGGVGLAGEGINYQFTGTMVDPTTGKSCGEKGCN